MVVVDANLLLVLVSGDARGNLALQQFTDWLDNLVELHAPVLGCGKKIVRDLVLRFQRAGET